MPIECLHMTTLEVAHSRTDEEISILMSKLEPHVKHITDYTADHRTRLLNPMITFDASALALSFVPAAGESRPYSEDLYTYLHLRRDIYDLCTAAGVPLGSRYVLPSSHFTLGRFVSQEDFWQQASGTSKFSQEALQSFVHKIDELNDWLKSTYWPHHGTTMPKEGIWDVGEEQGLECRAGSLWYGGGNRVRLGEGF